MKRGLVNKLIDNIQQQINNIQNTIILLMQILHLLLIWLLLTSVKNTY
jgi:hypothetical protein